MDEHKSYYYFSAEVFGESKVQYQLNYSREIGEVPTWVIEKVTDTENIATFICKSHLACTSSWACSAENEKLPQKILIDKRHGIIQYPPADVNLTGARNKQVIRQWIVAKIIKYRSTFPHSNEEHFICKTLNGFIVYVRLRDWSKTSSYMDELTNAISSIDGQEFRFEPCTYNRFYEEMSGYDMGFFRGIPTFNLKRSVERVRYKDEKQANGRYKKVEYIVNKSVLSRLFIFKKQLRFNSTEHIWGLRDTREGFGNASIDSAGVFWDEDIVYLLLTIKEKYPQTHYTPLPQFQDFTPIEPINIEERNKIIQQLKEAECRTNNNHYRCQIKLGNEVVVDKVIGSKIRLGDKIINNEYLKSDSDGIYINLGSGHNYFFSDKNVEILEKPSKFTLEWEYDYYCYQGTALQISIKIKNIGCQVRNEKGELFAQSGKRSVNIQDLQLYGYNDKGKSHISMLEFNWNYRIMSCYGTDGKYLRNAFFENEWQQIEDLLKQK